MLDNKIESLKINKWIYERHSFRSAILGKVVRYGLFHPETSVKINKTCYLLHGGAADDYQPVQAGLLPVISNLFNSNAQKDVQFVFPFIGNSFLHDHPTDKTKSFSDYFLKEIIPLCGEPTAPENRFICGWSMGGQASLNMFLRYPLLFGGAGAHYPTLVNFNFNDTKQQSDYAFRTNVTAPMMSVLIPEFQKEFVTTTDFSNHDPLQLAKVFDSKSLMRKKIYFDVGDQDDFGLFEGAMALHEIFVTKNISHQFDMISGGKHDALFIHAQISKMLNYLLRNTV